MSEDRNQESRVRRKAGRRGYTVNKSRQGLHCDNHGAFMLADYNNHIVLGDRFDATLDEIESYLSEL
jgi:hypothetical protein